LLDPQDLIEKLSVLVPAPRLHLLRFHGVLASHGAVTLRILRQIPGVTRVCRSPTLWATLATLQLLGGVANGVGVKHRRIELPGGTRHHLRGLEEATLDESSQHPQTDAEPIRRLVQ